MYEQLTLLNCRESTLFSEATPASRLAKLDESGQRPTSATCGQQCAGSCKSCDPLGWLERTLKATLPEDSMGSLMTWKQMATPGGRSVCQLSPLRRPISESGFLLWRTPNAYVIYPKSSVKKLTGRTPADPQVGLADQLGGRPNPEWVEWLMGYPAKWTDCEPLETR